MKTVKNYKMSVATSINKSYTTVGSSMDNESVINNIMQAIDILNKKGYQAEYCLSDTTISNAPYIRFGSKINEFTFAPTPIEMDADTIAGEFIIRITGKARENRLAELLKNSSLLLNWAKRLKKACTLYCEIDVPIGEDPEEFFYSAVADEFSVERLDYDGPFEVAGGDEAEYTLTFFIIVSPQMVKPISNSIRAFGELYGVLATVTERDSF
jgi:hypothetical protein